MIDFKSVGLKGHNLLKKLSDLKNRAFFLITPLHLFFVLTKKNFTHLKNVKDFFFWIEQIITCKKGDHNLFMKKKRFKKKDLFKK